MVVSVGIGAGFVALLRNINFAADDRMDSLFVRFVVELDSSKEIAVIRHGDGGHSLLLDKAHHFLDVAGAIEKRVVSVTVKVNERTFGHEDFLLV